MTDEDFKFPDISSDEVVAAMTQLFPLELRVLVAEIRAQKMAEIIVADGEELQSHLTPVPEVGEENGVAE